MHATDVSNASRTLMLNVHTNTWDEELLKLLDVPVAVLPAVFPSSHVYGHTKASSCSALRCRSAAWPATSRARCSASLLRSGLAKNTYGTGCFMLMHTGSQFQTSANGLITTSAAQPTAACRSSPSRAASSSAARWCNGCATACTPSGPAAAQQLAQSVPDSGGVMFVPAFTGLGAPYWKPEARAPSSG